MAAGDGGSDRGGEVRPGDLPSEEVLRAISDAAVEGIMLHQHGRIVSCNAAGAAMFGFPAHEMVGRPVRDLVAPDSWEEARARMDSDDAYTYVATVVRRDGSRFRVEVTSRQVRVADGWARAVVLRDLTEGERVERERAASLSLLRATIDAIADGILVVDRTSKAVLFNERFRQLWSLPSGTLSEGLTPGAMAEVVEAVERQVIDPRRFRERIAEVYNSPEESNDVLELRDGRTIERFSTPQRIGQDVVGRVWSFRDVTTHRRAERALELAVRMRDEFLGVASHELFTPITSLAVVIRGLRGAYPSEGRELTERLLSAAERQVDRLARLVHELLDVTRIEGGCLSLLLEEVDLGEVARDTLERFSTELERDGIVTTLDVPVPVIGRWDRTRVEQVLTNLLANAIKFGRGKPIEIAVRGTADRVELVVRDHGVGVPLERHAAIFERFQRGVSSRHYAGLGLGLFITRQIVEAHGGELRLQSEPGAGATFTVELPRSCRELGA